MRLTTRLAAILPLLLLFGVPSIAAAESVAASSVYPTARSVVCESLDPLTPAGCDPTEEPPADPITCPDGTTVEAGGTCPQIEPQPTSAPVPVPAPSQTTGTITEPTVDDYYAEVIPSVPQIPIPTTTPEAVTLWNVPTYAVGAEAPEDRTAQYALMASLGLVVVLGLVMLGRGLVLKIRSIRRPPSQRYGLSEDEATASLAPGDSPHFTAFDKMVLSYDKQPEPPAGPAADR